jgi:hypothetical protein
LTRLDRALLARVVERLRAEEPDAVAVLLTGSYAKGRARPDSDLDLVTLTRESPSVSYRTWFEERPGALPLHISAATQSIDGWLERAGRPESWSLGFPALFDAVYVWRMEEVVARLGDDPSQHHPAPSPELEDFIENAAKLKAAGDALTVRLFAHELALLAPGLLRSLNPPRVVRDRREALAAALELREAPAGWRDDFLTCLGFDQSDPEQVRESALRLARGVLPILRQRAPDIDPQPGIAEALADGTLERHLGCA